MRPGVDDIEDEVVDGGENVAHAVGSGLTAPPTVAGLADEKHSQLRHYPDDDSRK